MSNPEITRDILHGAMNKHGDNDDQDAFDRVMIAFGTIGRQVLARNELRESAAMRGIEPVGSTIPRMPEFRVSAKVYEELEQLTRQPHAERYTELAETARKLELR